MGGSLSSKNLGMNGKNSAIFTASFNECLPTVISRINGRVNTTTQVFTEYSGGAHASFIVNHNATIVEKIIKYLQQAILPISGRNYSSTPQESLAAIVASGVPESGSKVFFTSGGTEGIEMALRLALWIQRARGFSKKRIVISREFSYHGMSVYTRGIGDHHQHSHEDLGTFTKAANTLLTDPLLFSERVSECAIEFENLIHFHGEENIAALIVEPVGGTTAGAVVPPPGYLERLSEMCKKHKIILIADEVVTAFYRTGGMFFTSGMNVDIRVGGKCLSGGYGPICSVVISGEILEEAREFEQPPPLRLTYGGNPLMCCTALAVQEVIAEENLIMSIGSKQQVIERTINAFTCKNTAFTFRGTGLLWAIAHEVSPGKAKNAADLYSRKFKDLGFEILVGIRDKENSIHFMFTPALDIAVNELMAMTTEFCDAIKTIHDENII